MLRHLSNLRDEDISHADYIHGVCTLDIPLDNPETQIVDVFWNGRIEDTRKLPGQPYARCNRLTVEYPQHEDLAKLQARISGVVGWDITAVEDDD